MYGVACRLTPRAPLPHRPYSRYFAVHAAYAARPTYAKPNKHGRRHVCLASVVVGEWALGTKDMSTPPRRPQSAAGGGRRPQSVHLSTVDDVANPSIFVVYRDTAAYPLYLITFK